MGLPAKDPEPVRGKRFGPSSHPRSAALVTPDRLIGEVTTLRRPIIASGGAGRKSVAVT
jgi:hypothetical protein